MIARLLLLLLLVLGSAVPMPAGVVCHDGGAMAGMTAAGAMAVGMTGAAPATAQPYKQDDRRHRHATAGDAAHGCIGCAALRDPAVASVRPLPFPAAAPMPTTAPLVIGAAAPPPSEPPRRHG